MKPWAWTSLLLCVFGFLKEFRPSEPYIVEYLMGPWKNFTDIEVNQVIYPMITYSNLSQLILVFLVTDLLRYKMVIMLQGIAGAVSGCLLAFTNTMSMMQLMGFIVGTLYATDIAYFTYIYAKVDRQHFQKVTSYTQSAVLMSRFLSSVTGQVFVSLGVLDYHQLNYISIAAMSLGLVWTLFLPSVNESIYFHNKGSRKPTIVSGSLANEKSSFHTFIPSDPPTFLEKCLRGYALLWSQFKTAYMDWYVLKWSIWWALASCGFYQGYFYIQLLWERVAMDAGEDEEDLQTRYNGAASATYTMIGAAAAFGSGWLRLNWEVLGEATLAGCALLQGASLIVAAYATNIWIAYIGFIAFGVFFHTMFTIVNAEVAKHINADSYGLIFGVNTFFALTFQTILTVFVAGEGGLALDIRTQFLVYGGYFVVLGSVFALIALVSVWRGKTRKQPLWLPRDVEPVNP